MTNRTSYAFELCAVDILQHAAKGCRIARGLRAPVKCFALRLDHHLQDERRRLTRLMGDSPAAQAPSLELLQVDEALAVDCLWETLQTTRLYLPPSSRLHQICQWGISHLVTLEHGLAWHPNIDLSADHALQDISAKQKPPASAHSDMQALVDFLPHVVAALETSEMDSPLNLCADYLYDSVWEAHLHLAPQVSDSTFGVRTAVLRKDSMPYEEWKCLSDATGIALSQASIGGGFADFLQDAQTYLRLIGWGISSAGEHLPNDNGGEAL